MLTPEEYITHSLGLDYALIQLSFLRWPDVTQLCDFTLVLGIPFPLSHCAIESAP